MLLVYTFSTVSMLWVLYINNWEWRDNNLCCQIFQIRPNAVTKFLDFPLTIFTASAAGAAGGYAVTFVVNLLYPIVFTTFFGIIVMNVVASQYNRRQEPTRVQDPLIDLLKEAKKDYEAQNAPPENSNNDI